MANGFSLPDDASFPSSTFSFSTTEIKTSRAFLHVRKQKQKQKRQQPPPHLELALQKRNHWILSLPPAASAIASAAAPASKSAGRPRTTALSRVMGLWLRTTGPEPRGFASSSAAIAFFSFKQKKKKKRFFFLGKECREVEKTKPHLFFLSLSFY